MSEADAMALGSWTSISERMPEIDSILALRAIHPINKSPLWVRGSFSEDGDWVDSEGFTLTSMNLVVTHWCEVKV